MLTQLEKTTTATHDYHAGKFDGLIGLVKQSTNPDYLKGYFEGLEQFLGW